MAVLDQSEASRVDHPLVIAWIFWTYLLGATGPVTNLIFAMLGTTEPFDNMLNATYSIMALGFVYVALHHHFINVRWAIDRAVVYAVTIAVVVAVVTVFEFSIMTYGSRSIGIVGNATLEAVFAISIALLMRPLHRRIEIFFERTLFAAKHRIEKRLRTLARDCANFERADTLLNYVCQQTQRILSAREVVYFYGDAGGLVARARTSDGERVSDSNPRDVDADDPALVRMRAVQRAVDLERLNSVIGDDGTIFPIYIHGIMVGAFYCTNGSNHKYDPDERRLLLKIARKTATWVLILHNDRALPTPKAVGPAM